MIGTTAFGTYVPVYRLGRNEIQFDFIHIEENVRAAQMAYPEAGIKNPLKELSVAEVHDCFTIHEMIIYEDLGWSPKGQAKEDIEAGTLTLSGELPVNTDTLERGFGAELVL